MASRMTKFAIGLFVLTGLLIGAIIIIWIGAADIFLKGSLYTTYFDESVQGLQTDSAVKYRGVEIGKVESIKVAPDYKLIEVTMKINLSGDLQKHTVAQLRTAGITGIVFIELDRIKPDHVLDFQEVPFKTSYPIIPSRRSEASRFLTDANIIMQDIKSIDFKGISDRLKNTAKAMETFLTSNRLTRIMANLESTSVHLDESLVKIRKTVDEGEMERIIKNTSDTLSEAQRLINSARQEIEAMKLAEQSTKAGQVMDSLKINFTEQTAKAGEILDSLDKRTNSIALELQDTSENLRATSEYLQTLAESLNNNPSELIFSRPAPPRKYME